MTPTINAFDNLYLFYCTFPVCQERLTARTLVGWQYATIFEIINFELAEIKQFEKTPSLCIDWK